MERILVEAHPETRSQIKMIKEKYQYENMADTIKSIVDYFILHEKLKGFSVNNSREVKDEN